MNLRPPPKNPSIEDLERWCNELYEFLQLPTFEVIKFVPRSSSPMEEAGVTYYDSDDNKAKTHNNTAFQDLY